MPSTCSLTTPSHIKHPPNNFLQLAEGLGRRSPPLGWFTIHHHRRLHWDEEYPNNKIWKSKCSSKFTYPNHYEFTNYKPLPPRKDSQVL